ncbi:ABC transporter permease [Clavibacter michiganensis]|uniref:ABC transporter permease n=1 Tax=Clavibacter michiganensis TaxID=28447 RepID=UPI000A3A9FC6|nr:ABC transporter permease [Clavibacter michiganensis]MBW8026981.1 ABC transporter permease [Clavibacter michiganensis subsp. michiganensis]MDO4033216.1 ABC transporter permease [Clavibacter michiganensis]MDO4081724.1 ABC transporter permease [Clavibacter michiganensis]MDO4086719.1 ABC transporter permease [Clavibacter michiganensis]MDO4097976.1 ABC transporter permease [Clavibacter michiganensis]
MSYAIRRAGQAVIVLVLAYVVAYVLLAALPGDAVLARYGSPELGLAPEQLAAIRESYGADRPLIVRLGESAAAFAQGQLGYSVQSGAAVSTLLATAIPSTLVLAVLGLLVAVVLAVPIAFLATYGGARWIRRVFRDLPPLLVSLPVFWVGIILIQVLSFRLGLVPIIGASPGEALILPVLTIAVPIAAPLAQVLIRSIDDVSAMPFVEVVRARGADTPWLLLHGVGRNALLPTLTMAGLLFGELVGGAVVTEAVFGRAGVGQLTVQAVASRDSPVLLAVVVLSTVAYVVINLAVDLLYPVLDARLRRGGAR